MMVTGKHLKAKSLLLTANTNEFYFFLANHKRRFVEIFLDTDVLVICASVGVPNRNLITKFRTCQISKQLKHLFQILCSMLQTETKITGYR